MRETREQQDKATGTKASVLCAPLRIVIDLNRAMFTAGPVVGTYIAERKALISSDVACQYCKIEMKQAIPAERVTQVMRLGKLLSPDRQEAWVYPAPDGWRFYACYQCRQMFSLPAPALTDGDPR